MNIASIELIGKHVQLVPLKLEHLENLKEAVQDGDLYKLWYTKIPSPEMMESEIKRRLNLQSKSEMIPFTVIDTNTKKIVGMTTYCRIDRENLRLEIGFTWYSKSVQKTLLNTEAKLLLLQHAFENFNCVAVEFRTNQFNFNSRRAIERLGAKLDGILRSARLQSDGATSDGYVYSIIKSEWPIVKTNLLYKLNHCYT